MKNLYLRALIVASFLFAIGCNPPQKEEQTSELFTPIEVPSAKTSSLPYLIKGNDGILYISWVEEDDQSDSSHLYYASWNEDRWSNKNLIASGNDWFVNWADYPMLAVDREGNMLAHYLQKSSSGTYSYDIKVRIKPTDSTLWTEPFTPHTDGTPTEHGFVTALPNNDGSFTLAWLDGRNTGEAGHSDHSHGGAMTLRTAVVGLDGSLSEESQLDNRVCDCCQTSGTMTTKGPVFVYRDRSDNEIRDISFVQNVDNQWTDPKPVAQDNWEIAGCPVNGPRMDSHNDVIAIAWYTNALNRAQVKVAFHKEGEFQAPIIIDQTSPVGRVDIEMIDESTATISWIDGGNTPTIKFRTVNINGSMTSAQVITEISKERSSGFPQMEHHDGQLFFAWTEIGESSSIQMKSIPLK